MGIRESADVNYLLSAIVQSGAAIVAIVAGFAGSRALSARAALDAAERVRNAAEARMHRAKANLGNARDSYHWSRAENALMTPKVLVLLANSADVPSSEAVRAVEDLRSLDYDDIDIGPNLIDLHRTVHRYLKDFRDLVVANAPHGTSWETFKANHGISPEIEDIQEWVFRFLWTQARGHTPNHQARSETVKYAARAAEGEARAEFQEAVSAWREASTGFEIAERDLIAVARPEAMGSTVAVLAWVAVSSIAVPAALMVPSVTAYPTWVKIGVVALLLSAIVVLLWHLLSNARSKPDRESANGTSAP